MTDRPAQSVPSSASVDWQPWTADAFAHASATGRPVLLSITAAWCHGCGVMDAGTYADAQVAEAIRRSVVPVRVDADVRPDIHERYHLEGLPTTLFLTPSGEMLTGTTYLPSSGLFQMIDEVARAYARDREALDERARSAAAARRTQGAPDAPADPDLAAPAWLAGQLVQRLDREFGGFGTGAKFPHAAALLAGVLHYEQSPDPALADAIARTLDGMARGGLCDQADGGFFRATASREWMRPHTEKLLEDQAALVRVYLEAARVFGRDDWRDVARATIAFVHARLSDPETGRFFASQAADAAYHQMRAAGIAVPSAPPRVDRRLFADRSARAISAWLRAAAVTGDGALAGRAAAAMTDLLAHTYRPGAGVAHVWDDRESRVRGLLADQVYVARALLDLHDADGARRWLDAAADIMRTALGELADPAGAALLDRPSGSADAVGLLADPLRPLAPNAEAAIVLTKLSRALGEPEFHGRGLDVLRALSGGYRRHGLAAAPYVLAVLELLGPSGPASPDPAGRT
ncbi:MAG TPA: DUF255 domain-containing protein [Vicinamibacterales bacterium]